MAVFTAANPNLAVNMYQLFAFEPIYGANTIQLISPAPGAVVVSDFSVSAFAIFSIKYSNVNGSEIFDFDETTPESGSFDKMEIFSGSELQGALSGITPGLGNFGEIDLPLLAYKVLLGDDTITGSNLGDFLFTGDGGTDTVDAKGGNDVIDMAATAFAPFHSINGGTGTDTIQAFSNIFSADTVLDLRNATLQSIEALTIEGGITVRLLGSQIGAGVSSAAGITKSFGTGDATLEVVLNAAGAADLSGFTVGAGVSIKIFGSTGADTITGSNVSDAIRGEGGKDVLTGGAGGDTFEFLALADSAKKKALRDTITDFTKGDRIDLSGIDASTKKGGDQAFKFTKKEGAALKKAGNLVYDQIDKKGTAKDMTIVYADTNGDKKADMAIALKGIVDLSKGDFLL